MRRLSRRAHGRLTWPGQSADRPDPATTGGSHAVLRSRPGAPRQLVQHLDPDADGPPGQPRRRAPPSPARQLDVDAHPHGPLGSPRITARLKALLAPARTQGYVAAAPPVAIGELLRRFWPFARPYRRRIALGLLPLLAVPAVEAVEIWLFGVVVDDVLVPRDLADARPGRARVRRAGAPRRHARVRRRRPRDLDRRAVPARRAQRPARARPAPHARTPSTAGGSATSVAHHADVAAIESFLLAGIAKGISAVVRIVFFGGALFLISWQLALLALVVAPLVVSSRRATSRGSSGTRRARSADGLARSPRSPRRAWQPRRSCRASTARRPSSTASAARTRGSWTPSWRPRASARCSRRSSTSSSSSARWRDRPRGLALSAGDLTLGGLLVFLTFLARSTRRCGALGPLQRPLQRRRRRGAGARAARRAARGRRRAARPAASAPVRRSPRAARRLLPPPARGAPRPRRRRPRGPAGGARRDHRPERRRQVDAGPAAHAVHRSDGGRRRARRPRPPRPHAGVVRDHVGAPAAGHAAARRHRRATRSRRAARASRTTRSAAARAAGVHDVRRSRSPRATRRRSAQRGAALSGGAAPPARDRPRVRARPARARARRADDRPRRGRAGRLLASARSFVADRTTVVITHDPAVMAWADRVIELRDGVVVSDRRWWHEAARAGGADPPVAWRTCTAPTASTSTTPSAPAARPGDRQGAAPRPPRRAEGARALRREGRCCGASRTRTSCAATRSSGERPARS